MDWLHYKKIYFLLSGIAIAVGIFSLLTWGLKLGVDFRGGSILEYKFEKEISTEKLIEEIKNEGFDNVVIQTTGANTYLIKLPPLQKEDKEKIASATAKLISSTEEPDQATVSAANIEELRFETVGPSVGPELVKKTVYAILISSGMILLWVAFQFKNIKFGVSAILAMFHDTFILIGFFSLLGHFFGAEVDFLFVTALLTTLSFSVHDTIVVFDRIREIKKQRNEELKDIANRALTETMVRSLNNSFTIIFMLIALLLLGGSTIKWFAGALLIGTILGTYSSPFVAVPLLVSWDNLVVRIKSFRRK
ncbi:protein-export membrane protein SecF [Candidatus Woesebacteria bacterium RBG_16_34_12]|uniref:Protein-export membrane protein SecF n=1 Tax=Candidatus Woesebacteria bacterium RBG_16_34_12 TaxID=1802480 RepID=A0A1F7XA51_9BACT|nr:MAG: protein-export membrane protein SecF [Candidatus Woesebacteria bacterium RBG_16_34_12]